VPVHWGVLGPGGIAGRFGEAMRLVPDGTILAVASRAQERADAYGDRFGVARRYSSYEELVEHADVDAVYIATPASRHADDAVLALEAGKHVLCEKPFALNAAQARRMVAAARENGLFLMEAMWSRFLPAYGVLSDLLGSGRIGEVRLLEADFGLPFPFDPRHRHFDLAVGGGALLDLGIYPVQLASLVLGAPHAIQAQAHIGTTGVDEVVTALMQHDGGRYSVVKAAISALLECTARVAGTLGAIELPAFMHCPTSVTLHSRAGTEEIDCGWEGDGLRFQVAEVHRCLTEGLRESPTMPLDESVSIAVTLDAIRARIGLVYPDEVSSASS
jgi:predicted dehydrogenase